MANAQATLPRFRWGVVYYPGTNCELETRHVLAHVLDQDADLVFHTQTDLTGYDALVVAGGFAHGDYLRSGAIARFSPVTESLIRFAGEGRPVLGICNGFQVLLEAGLLPGAMLHNRSQKFVSAWTHLRVERAEGPFLNRYRQGEVLRVPVAHGEGNWFADADALGAVKAQGQMMLRYCDAEGNITEAANPNGSLENLAGLSSVAGNVMGLMPHPERAAEPELGSADGRRMFESVVHWLAQRR